MQFTSLNYIIFLSFIVLLNYIINPKYKWILLLLSSCLFYLSFLPINLIFIVGIIIINYFACLLLSRIDNGYKNFIFWLIIVLDILVLVIYKFIDKLIYQQDKSNILSTEDVIIIPIGLSFIVFTIISYVIEINRKNYLPETNLGKLATYILFFSKVQQGPIERYKSFVSQLNLPKRANFNEFINGLQLII